MIGTVFIIVLLVACGGRNLTEEIGGTWVFYPQPSNFDLYFTFNEDGTGHGTDVEVGRSGMFDWEIIDTDLYLEFHDWDVTHIWNEIVIDGDVLILDQFQGEEGRPLNFNRQ